MSFVSMFPSLVTWDIPWIVVVRNKRKWTTLSNTKENIFQCKRTFLGFYILKLEWICANIFWVQERNLKQRICFIKASFISKCYNNIKTAKDINIDDTAVKSYRYKTLRIENKRQAKFAWTYNMLCIEVSCS